MEEMKSLSAYLNGSLAKGATFDCIIWDEADWVSEQSENDSKSWPRDYDITFKDDDEDWQK